jgi:hypothetical protein
MLRAFGIPGQPGRALAFEELRALFSLALQFQKEALTKAVAEVITAGKLNDSDAALCLALASKHSSIFSIQYQDKLFRQLCERPDCLTDDEAVLLGAVLTASIARWRLKLNSRAISEGSAFMPSERGEVCIDKSPRFEEVRDSSGLVGFWRIKAV